MSYGSLDMRRYYEGPDTDVVTMTTEGIIWRTQTWRQVGWLGIATNRIYSLGEDTRSDPAGVSPLWLLIDNATMPEAQEPHGHQAQELP